jgi:epsilon-lactone hydrolase
VVTTHPLDPDDATFVTAVRALAKPAKGATRGVEARDQYDLLIGGVMAPDGVTFEVSSVGGVSGFWVHPEIRKLDEAILHLHGGWFNFGSAKAYRNLVGHIAARANASAFVPDYRLAPEHPFPAAIDDAMRCYRGFVASGVRRFAITGDSAGGNLALGIGSRVAGETALEASPLAAIAVLSPVTDLTLSGATYDSRADADPFFTRSQIALLVQSYLVNADANEPEASPLFGRHAGMPPVRIYVGDDEVLLDDSLRYAEIATKAGVDARVDVWEGMPHGFPINIGKLKAAAQALDAMGAFLSERLQTPAGHA